MTEKPIIEALRSLLAMKVTKDSNIYDTSSTLTTTISPITVTETIEETCVKTIIYLYVTIGLLLTTCFALLVHIYNRNSNQPKTYKEQAKTACPTLMRPSPFRSMLRARNAYLEFSNV